MLILYRDLVESLHRIGKLRRENRILLAALHSVSESDDLNAKKQREIMEIVAKVYMVGRCWWCWRL
jgi:hypothetical protein